jgi:hypothetical protein
MLPTPLNVVDVDDVIKRLVYVAECCLVKIFSSECLHLYLNRRPNTFMTKNLPR